MIPFNFAEPTGNRIVDNILRRLVVTLDSIVSVIVTNERLVRVSFLGTGNDVAVWHGVGAQVRTWEVVDIDADATLWQSTTVNPNPRNIILLRSSAACSVLLRFT